MACHTEGGRSGRKGGGVEGRREEWKEGGVDGGKSLVVEGRLGERMGGKMDGWKVGKNDEWWKERKIERKKERKKDGCGDVRRKWKKLKKKTMKRVHNI